MLALKAETLNMTVINEGDVRLKSRHLPVGENRGLYAAIADLEDDDLFICEAKVPSKPFFGDEQLSTSSAAVRDSCHEPSADLKLPGAMVKKNNKKPS